MQVLQVEKVVRLKITSPGQLACFGTRAERLAATLEKTARVILPYKSKCTASLGQQELITKFPSTRHLYNLGAATKDDKVFTNSEAAAFPNPAKPGHRIVVQEKVDGGNMGVSIDPVTLEIRTQNRSKYITPRTHPQYADLWFWLNSKRDELWEVLTGGGRVPPGQLIMFGEWLAAKHSIHYTRLPDTFLAFDILDVSNMQFYSNEKLQKVLQATAMKTAPVLAERSKFTKQELLKMVEQRSKFYDGLVEGVYIRLDSEDSLLDRAKIVRSTFIAGNQEWDKGQIVRNVIIS